MAEKIWKIQAKNPSQKSKNWLLSILAANRGLRGKKLENFFNPSFDQILAVKLTDTQKALKRITQAIANKEKIIVYSDYDADGICATAIMWETLYDLGADVLPYVPHRIKEGYGLSSLAISRLAKKGVSLIITVDHGVTAKDQVAHAQSLGIDVVITDHHVLPKQPPKALAVVHTTQLCGAGVAWRLAWEIVQSLKSSYKDSLIQKLELSALATIADLVPLVGANRTIVKLGLEKIAKTQRPGIRALIAESQVKRVGTYEVGHILAPRINAMGRIEHGLDALRLLCAKSDRQATELARLLSKTNSKRQNLTTTAIAHALELYSRDEVIGVISHSTWHEGVIGLVASRLVETFHKPMIVIAQGSVFSKGSARSIPGFNIVEAIRSSSEFLVDGGGHPMAAGFTIKTKHLQSFRQKIIRYAASKLTEEDLKRKIFIECELEKPDITSQTLKIIEKFEPFGIGNPSPLFLTREMLVEDVRTVGQAASHLKLQVSGLGAIGFGMGEQAALIRPGQAIDLVFSLGQDNFNGNDSLVLKIKDLAWN